MCNKSVDLLFVLDGGQLQFKLGFAKSIIDRFAAGVNQTRGKFVAMGLSNNSVHPLDVLEDEGKFTSYLENNKGSLISAEEFFRTNIVKVCSASVEKDKGVIM